MRTTCPTEGNLQRLLDSQLPADATAELTTHLEGCFACRSTMDRLAGANNSWPAIASVLKEDDSPNSPALRHVLSQLRAQPPAIPERTEATTAPDEGEATLAPAENAPGLPTFRSYLVQAMIGEGGMGRVYRAFDPALHHVVAIKMLADSLAGSGPARQRFLREARAAAAVVHEHVVVIHAVAQEGETPYIVMQYVKGQSLQDRIDKGGPLSVLDATRIGMQAAQGLAAAHAQGLVHRDVKPANILLENGVERVKITDFGLARAVDDASLTQSGVIAGTPQYMSPEQANGETLDHRSDLFSLGSVLYAMCTGHPPFRASNTMGVLMRVCQEEPRPIREVNAEIPEWLAKIITKLMAKDPANRYRNATEVAKVLSKGLGKLQHRPRKTSARSALPTSIPVAVPPRRARGIRVAVGIAVLAVLLAGGAVWLSGLLDSQSTTPTTPQPNHATPALAVAPFNAAQAREYQDAWARHLGSEPVITNSIGMKLRLIPPGEFVMGTSKEEVDRLLVDAEDWQKPHFRSERPQRQVRIRQHFSSANARSRSVSSNASSPRKTTRRRRRRTGRVGSPFEPPSRSPGPTTPGVTLARRRRTITPSRNSAWKMLRPFAIG